LNYRRTPTKVELHVRSGPEWAPDQRGNNNKKYNGLR